MRWAARRDASAFGTCSARDSKDYLIPLRLIIDRWMLAITSKETMRSLDITNIIRIIQKRIVENGILHLIKLSHSEIAPWLKPTEYYTWNLASKRHYWEVIRLNVLHFFLVLVANPAPVFPGLKRLAPHNATNKGPRTTAIDTTDENRLEGSSTEDAEMRSCCVSEPGFEVWRRTENDWYNALRVPTASVAQTAGNNWLFYVQTKWAALQKES